MAVYHPQAMCQVVGCLNVWIMVKEYLSPDFLRLSPLLCRFDEKISTSGEQLLSSITVLKNFRLIVFPRSFRFGFLSVLLIEGIPAEANAKFL